jgi:hypothetical protein
MRIILSGSAGRSTNKYAPTTNLLPAPHDPLARVRVPGCGADRPLGVASFTWDLGLHL